MAMIPYPVCTIIFRELQTLLPIKHPVLAFESQLLHRCPLLSESYLPRVNWKVSSLSHTRSLESGDICLLWTIQGQYCFPTSGRIWMDIYIVICICIYIYIYIYTHTVMAKNICTHMIKEGCENESALLILLICYKKNTKIEPFIG